METQARLKEMLAVIGSRKRILICTHNNPDPDSLASALALKTLLAKVADLRSTMCYGGTIARASNKVMVRQCRIEINHKKVLPQFKNTVLALVDAQPGGTHTLIPRGTKVDIVIDHHQASRWTRNQPVAFKDIRTGFGACSTIMEAYLKVAQVSLDKRLATALFYGIKTDIGDIGRMKADRDLEALARIYPQASQKLLARIESPKLPRIYFQMLLWGLNRAVTYRDVAVAKLNGFCNPDIVSEMADLLLRMEGIRWSLVCGMKGDDLIFSVRSSLRNVRAGNLVARLVAGKGSAGGHNQSAAGRMKIETGSAGREESWKKAQDEFVHHFLKLIKRQDAIEQQVRPNVE